MGQPDSPTAVRVSIQGVVQGVGFRPFVNRIASRYRILGWVRNVESGVDIHAEGSDRDIRLFLKHLDAGQPIAATIRSIDVDPTSPQGCRQFEILDSTSHGTPTALLTPDLTVCAECLQEMTDPGNRRYKYPYINCSNCGPRYSILWRLPYDRPNTTMASWRMCLDCQREYLDPDDRRHHAQPTACAACGPAYHFIKDGVRSSSGEPAIGQAVELLRSGGILAVKGIGGFHLSCDALNKNAVEQLRTRKYRKDKPFAIMTRSLGQARKLAHLTEKHEQMLTDVSRPIVLAPAKRRFGQIAPDTPDVGLMLPYAPLHHLLFDSAAPSPLVMTSANKSSDPIAYRDEDALNRLAGIADAFLIGDRPIARRVDDSVISVRNGRCLMMRRARGWSPGVVCRVPTDAAVLAVGADLKNSVALSVGGEVIVSQHIGDLEHLETFDAFEQTITDLLEMYEFRPEVMLIAHDLHPQFRSTRFAKAFPAAGHIAVQHHHAHIASVLAEHHRFDETVVGVAFDGTGLGTDHSIWGGEFFVGSIERGFERHGSLRAVSMPGGDAAARYPVQAAAGFLAELDNLPDLSQPPFCFPVRFTNALKMVKNGLRCFQSTSAGRLFDTVAALLGFTSEVSFEGQAAIWLETLAHQAGQQVPYEYSRFDHRPLLSAIIADRLAGRDRASIASAFHSAVAVEVVHQIERLCGRYNLSSAVISGGVFQNELLSKLVHQASARAGISLLTNSQVPANDGGICLGQMALAAARI